MLRFDYLVGIQNIIKYELYQTTLDDVVRKENRSLWRS